MKLLDLPPDSDPDAMDRVFLREECRGSLSAFVQAFWDVVEPGNPLVWNWHLSAMADHLQAIHEGLFDNLIICIPPGFMKSLMVSVFFQPWEWTRKPWLRELYGSYQDKLTFRDSMKAKALIKSDRYQWMFEPDWQIRRDADSKGMFENDVYGSRVCYYVTSRKVTGWRGDRVCIDDPLSAKDRYNNRVKQEVIDVWDGVLSTRVNLSSKTSFVVIMQRLSDNDLVGHILEKYKDDYVSLVLPSEFEPETRCVTPIFADPRTEPGELLFPELCPREKVDWFKLQLGSVDYQAQFQHRPVPLGGGRFQAVHFQFWSYDSSIPCLVKLQSRSGIVEFVRLDLVEQFLTVDVAASEKTEADFTVIKRWAIDQKMNLILLHREKFQGPEPVIIQKIRQVYEMKQWGRNLPSYVGIEANGLGLPIAQSCRSAGVPVMEIFVHRDKLVMSAIAVVRLAGGQIYFPQYKDSPWMHDMVRELLAFPSGAHDDTVSALSLAANAIYERKPGVITGGGTTLGTLKPNSNASRIRANLAPRSMFGVGR